MSRPCNCRRIGNHPHLLKFGPLGMTGDRECLTLNHDCFEAVRLADYLGMSTNQAAEKMGISRHTYGRLLRRGHGIIAKALCASLNLQIEGGNCVIDTLNLNKGEDIMSEAILVTVPSDAPGGLEAVPSAHFGHCAFYTVAKIQDGKIEDVQIVPNSGHEHGGCVQPVQQLAQQGVKALLAGGMGMKPLRAMQDAGMEVYYCVGQPTVDAALQAFIQGKLQPFGKDQLCTGCHGHH